jgi:hypothetical protein
VACGTADSKRRWNGMLYGCHFGRRTDILSHSPLPFLYHLMLSRSCLFFFLQRFPLLSFLSFLAIHSIHHDITTILHNTIPRNLHPLAISRLPLRIDLTIKQATIHTHASLPCFPDARIQHTRGLLRHFKAQFVFRPHCETEGLG